MTVHTTPHRNRRHRTGRLIAASAIALVLAILSGFVLASATEATASGAERDATHKAMTTPPAPLKIAIGEPDPEPPTADTLRPLPHPDDCPQGTIYYDGQCLEFIPPSDECPQGTIEHNGECLEFEVPDCGPGYALEHLDCVPLEIAEPNDPIDCPQGTIYHDGQCLEFIPPSDECPQGTIEHNGECLEFEVPECDLGYVLVGLECEKLKLDAIPVQPTPVVPAVPVVPPVLDAPEVPEPEPTPVVPAVPVVPPVLDAPEVPDLSEDDCPQGTIYHDGQCVEFVPPTDECPQGTIEHNGECLEFEVPDCELGYVVVGLDCVKLVLEATTVQVDPVPAVPVLPEARFGN